MTIDPDRLKSQSRPHGLPFRISKIGHVVLNVTDLEALGALLYPGPRVLGCRTSTRPKWCPAAWCSCAATPTITVSPWSAPLKRGSAER